MLTSRQVLGIKVDPSGTHCFIICVDALFYANFFSDKIHEIRIPAPKIDQESLAARNFVTLDTVKISDDDLTAFEVVLGRKDGSVWHACYQGTEYNFEEFDKITQLVPPEALSF